MQGSPLAEQVETTANDALQVEFDGLFEHLSKLTTQVKGIKASADVDWKKAVAGIDVTWLDSYGSSVPYELRGAGIRRLFMVAYFQYKVAQGMHDPSGPRFVFAIEEPEVHLHPSAQRELMGASAELVRLGHTVVFTTHSPVFASLAPGEALALVTREDASADIAQAPELVLADVARELGVEASDSI